MDIRDLMRLSQNFFDQGIDDDESVVFYPSHVFRDTLGRWKLEVRGV